MLLYYVICTHRVTPKRLLLKMKPFKCQTLLTKLQKEGSLLLTRGEVYPSTYLHIGFYSILQKYE